MTLNIASIENVFVIKAFYSLIKKKFGMASLKNKKKTLNRFNVNKI